MQSKIKTLKDAKKIFSELRKQGKKIIQCHGVFDLLHPGHIRHFQDAKSKGHILVVSVTSDRYVNKGPGRPVFNQQLRMESIEALDVVDYVILSDSCDAIEMIQVIKPDFYVKGQEYQDSDKDLTQKIDKEKQTTEENGGSVFFTTNLVCSSSKLLNRFFDPLPKDVQAFVSRIKKSYSLDEIIDRIEALAELKVLVIGDAILDEYQYISPLGQSGKGFHIVGSCLDRELFLGGSLIVSNHIAEFTKNISLVTAIGDETSSRRFIEENLHQTVDRQFVYLPDMCTLTKKRYIQRDGRTLVKFFETYSTSNSLLNADRTDEVLEILNQQSGMYDLILVADFGNGFTNPRLIKRITEMDGKLAINSQINSGNRGFNSVTQYRRGDFISLNEPELRLAMQDRYASVENLIHKLSEKMGASQIVITQGVAGSVCYGKDQEIIYIPAFNNDVVDRVGAGDSYFALSSLCFANGYPPILSSFIGALAAAMDVQIVGNKHPIEKSKLCKYLTRLMK